MENREEYYRYWLSGIPGIGNKTMRLLLDCYGSAEEVFRTEEKILKKTVSEKVADRILNHNNRKNIFSNYEKLQAGGIHFTYFGAKNYPKKLQNIPDAPEVLYYMGKLPDENRPAIAIIGARMCSSYGKEVAAHFGSKLAEADIQIISGLAWGIDSIGQFYAVEAGGESFAVMGCGPDICYPSENRSLYEKLKVHGGIISEYPPGTEPKARLFPPRNRIISGLSDLLLVVEAKEKSGTLITVDMALEQGRDVYAVPGRINDALSVGCNRLIRQGAGVASSPEEFVQALGWKNSLKKKEKESEEISEEKNEILQVLDTEPKTIDEIMVCLQKKGYKDIKSENILYILTQLCIDGMARSEGACRFAKKKLF